MSNDPQLQPVIDQFAETAASAVATATERQADKYSDEQLQGIAREIMNQALAKRRGNQTYLGKSVKEDWDPNEFMSEMYENYLRAVQQEKSGKITGNEYTVYTSFEAFLKDCLDTLTWRRGDLKRELSHSIIDMRTYQNAKTVIEMSEEAIKKYLEKGPTARLIGV